MHAGYISTKPRSSLVTISLANDDDDDDDGDDSGGIDGGDDSTFNHARH